MTVKKPILWGIWETREDGTAAWVRASDHPVLFYHYQRDAEAKVNELYEGKPREARIDYEVREYEP